MPKKRKQIKITVPAELMPLIDQRLIDEGFDSYAKYFLSNAIYDLFTRSKHTVSAQLVNGPPAELYKGIEEIVKHFPEAHNGMSDWLKRRIERLKDETPD